MDASLFDDNIDIFADLTDSLKPKPKSKSKVDTKSIFDDDMGEQGQNTSVLERRVLFSALCGPSFQNVMMTKLVCLFSDL